MCNLINVFNLTDLISLAVSDFLSQFLIENVCNLINVCNLTNLISLAVSDFLFTSVCNIRMCVI